jgi:hypothetical protein
MKLHPTLKACKCGFIGGRTQLYNHLKHAMLNYIGDGTPASNTDAWRRYFNEHGESVLNEGDPRVLQSKTSNCPAKATGNLE